MPNLIPFLDNPTDGYQLILVPAGEAIFGSREDDRGSDSDEKPQFRAYLPDYYLGKYPVRNAEYARFLDEVRPNDSKLSKWILLNSDCHVVKVGEGYRVRGEEGIAPQEAGQGEHLESGWADHPVVQVSWWGAEAYCKWAGLRLPTELEWEKGARGVAGEVYPWGNEWDANKCRNSTSKGSGRTSIVWAYPEGCSVWGHHQMAGNVWEWCGDWYESKAHRRYAKGDLTPPVSGTYRALRGGSWYDADPACFRCAFRDRHFPGVRNYLNFGFRCARDARSAAEGRPESELIGMTLRERIIAALKRDGPMCDDCLVPAAQLRWRQQANSRCRQLAEEGLILRERRWCPACNGNKIVNALRDAPPVPDPRTPAPPSNPSPLDLGSVDLERNILEFLHGDEDGKAQGRGPRDRYASFDYCFNYFQSFREADATETLATPEHVQTSCLQLGFYLASWGMLRGSTFLLKHSLAVYEPVVRAVARMDPAVWGIDAHCYTEENLAKLLKCRKTIGEAFGDENRASDTLVTKVMLGVFGNVPAFDTFVCRALSELLGVRSFGRRSLRALGNFYETHRDVIERHRVPTLAFATGQDTSRRYTRAKVMDMAFFIKGQQ